MSRSPHIAAALHTMGRGHKGPFAQRVMLRTGYELRHPQLFDLLSTAHARYARQVR
ncbi:hypothetical protein [Brevibacterium marinum]|uniref:Uncharacterized protein n=1 Tax=Brevibacterium marinum TaxID=418643 RepID=A0A846S4G4_9MICO|nr:hypothetical protein [Brevibacterium marinum]NJC57878.1 hypothetical protein [Brevibacterium marinum]